MPAFATSLGTFLHACIRRIGTRPDTPLQAAAEKFLLQQEIFQAEETEGCDHDLMLRPRALPQSFDSAASQRV